MRVVLASSNPGKQREFQRLLAPLGIELLLQSIFDIDAPEETGVSFEENALLKARHAAEISGLPALADDSGLEVDALGGRPGVRSARYSGADANDAANNARLLAELAGIPAVERGARYRCVLAFVRDVDDAAPILASGVWEGRIAESGHGAGGFGYDPLFIPAGHAVTAAELPPGEKDRLSHRGKALNVLVERLVTLGAGGCAGE
jgi:XTP/dITP diphosphohydrolase